MKYGLVIKILSFAYAIGLMAYLFLFYYEIKIIFLTNFIIILSVILIITKLFYWYSIKKTIIDKTNYTKDKILFRGLFYYICAYLTPVYCIIQEPNLVVSNYVSLITLTIVICISITCIFLEFLFFDNKLNKI